MPWVIEGILTTRNSTGTINIAPQGPIRISEERWLLRPFQGSRTLENLLRERCGVFHITDDVLLLAQTAVGEANPHPRLQACTKIVGQYLADSCQALEFQVHTITQQEPRVEIEVEIVQRHDLRPFTGWNRAQFACLELAIMATRTHLVDKATIQAEVERWRPIITKTAGPNELSAWKFLLKYLEIEIVG
jgi:hypothetical protein